MATWDAGTAAFTCPKCGAVYECTCRDYPAPDPTQTFQCEVCGSTVHTWKGTRDYFDWKLKEGSHKK